MEHKNKHLNLVPNAPVVGNEEALRATGVYIDWTEGLKQQVSDLRRNLRLWQMVALVCLLGLFLVMPLKKRVPYFYEVNTNTGEISRSGRVAEELKVSDKNIAFFLRVWATRLVTINAATLRDGLPSAYRWTRGGATTQLDEWSEKEDQTAERIAKTPGLTREILGIPTISFNEDKTIALIDLVWIEKVNGVERGRRRKLLTVEFGLGTDHVKDRAAQGSTAFDDADNPLGLLITHFTINDQVVQ